jgi:hypothetical protein
MRTLTISLRLAGIIAGAVLALPLVVSAQNRTGLTLHFCTVHHVLLWFCQSLRIYNQTAIQR